MVTTGTGNITSIVRSVRVTLGELFIGGFLGEFFDRLRSETADARDVAGRERVRDLLGPVRREEA